MKNVIYLLIFSMLLVSNSYARQGTTHEILFKGSDHELHIFRVKGRVDGNTMLIIGGIQGDEPGGFLSADLYADLALERGNLIVVPRANFQSVILNNRGVKGDMNRLFTEQDIESSQGEVVNKLKELMQESDILLNLHDGWGFHSPTYISKNRNPNRFGQCVIIDAEEFSCGNKTLKLAEMSKTILEGVNSKIPNKDFHLELFNTKTGDNNSKFQDMKKTATWYALTNVCIPAFGIEGSKNMKSLEENVLYHNYAVNEFMKIMNIVPEQPKIVLHAPIMQSATVAINGEGKVLSNGATIDIESGDKVEVTYVESNYIRGVTTDFIGYGTLNDIGKSFDITSNTKIVFRKDNKVMGEIKINVNSSKYDGWQFFALLDGKEVTINNGDTLSVKSGSVIEFTKVSKGGSVSEHIINFKGWVPVASYNAGDDRGLKITLPNDRLMKKYSINGDTYPVTSGDNDNPFAKIYIKILK